MGCGWGRVPPCPLLATDGGNLATLLALLSLLKRWLAVCPPKYCVLNLSGKKKRLGASTASCVLSLSLK